MPGGRHLPRSRPPGGVPAADRRPTLEVRVTDLATTRDDPSAAAGPPPSPPARRLGRRRWRDSRLLIGVLLVLVSVVVGARVFASARTSSTWVVARADLSAGHVVTAADLTTTSADLNATTAHRYYPGNRLSEIVGAMLARPVSAGELISGDSFARGQTTSTRVVTVIVKDGRAPSLRPGDHVDVYVFRRDGSVATGGTGATTGAAGTTASGVAAAGGGVEALVLHDVEYLGEKVMSGGDRSLTLRVPVDLAIDAVAASQTGRVDIVLLQPDTTGGVASTGPTAIPGFGQ
jgi:SAF domain